ncbi:hypothetical protein GCM10018954_099140 [Kutzneria kofuensis]
MPAQHMLDLGRLHPLATDLDLGVGPADELELPVGGVPAEVAGPEDRRDPIRLERVGQEPLGRQLRSVDVSVGESGPTGVDLPRDARRHQPTSRIAQVDAHVQRPAGGRPRSRR